MSNPTDGEQPNTSTKTDDSGAAGPKARDGLELGWNPITFIAVGIVASVILFLAAGILGLDDGRVVARMSEADFARGIIAYLFAITTIGMAVVVGLGGLMGASDDQFRRGKDILALLLGVFGAVMGFYFASATVDDAEKLNLSLSPLNVAEANLQVGSQFTVVAFVEGGTPPRTFTITVGNEPVSAAAPVGPDGWLRTTVRVPDSARGEKSLPVQVTVTDADGKSAKSEADIPIGP